MELIEKWRLLKSVEENKFDALVTSDKNIVHQHKLSKFSFRFIILDARDNQYSTLLPMVKEIEQKILSEGGQVVYIG